MSHVQDQPAPGPTAPGPDDPAVIQAVEEYLAELEAGCRPDRQRLLARYPDLAGLLAECLDGLDLVCTARQSLRPLWLPKPTREPSGEICGSETVVILAKSSSWMVRACGAVWAGA